MTFQIEELDYQDTPFGELSLRRRAEPRLNGKIAYEVKLGDEFLMSSLFTEAEEQLALLGLASITDSNLDVIVGGLGLGYTTLTALQDDRVRSVRVIDVLQRVIDWHTDGLVPLGKDITSDPRCTLVTADFFALATSKNTGFDVDNPDVLVHAVLLDIDHSPGHWLNPQNQHFYCVDGLNSLSQKLHPGGIFAMWSNDPPEISFIQLLEKVFDQVTAETVSFPNPYSGEQSTNTVYVARDL